MRRRLIRPEDTRAMPWKNGGGTTREIASHPAGAGLDDFLWRVSVADVGASGPFSRFPGIDRVIAVIEGAGMTLRGPDGDIALLPLRPHAFAGETAIEGVLTAGPVRDFNVMTRRGRTRAVVTLGAEARGPARAPVVLIYCAKGAAGVITSGAALLLEDVPIGAGVDPMAHPEAVLLRVDIGV